MSIDHDLGDDFNGTGYDVIVWIENEVATKNFNLPEIILHTFNLSARKKMQLGVENIYNLLKKR